MKISYQGNTGKNSVPPESVLTKVSPNVIIIKLPVYAFPHSDHMTFHNTETKKYVALPSFVLI
jgi:hypothetical protein